MTNMTGTICKTVRHLMKRFRAVFLSASAVASFSCGPDAAVMQILAEEDRGTYGCRLIEFTVPDTCGMVEGGETLRAYLLVPDKASEEEPCPAILMLHDHGARFDIGKEKLVSPVAGAPEHVRLSSQQWSERYFDGAYMADTLASMGYVVLVHDALYWGDRASADARRWSELSFGKESPVRSGNIGIKDSLKILKRKVFEGQKHVYDSLLSEGRLWAEKILADDMAAASFLSSLPFVDKDRTGAFGFSMGAHRCWLLAAFSDDVHYGAAACWMLCKEDYDSTSVSDLSMRIPELRDRYDFPEIARFTWPKPMMFVNGAADPLFPEKSAAEAFRIIMDIYSSAASGQDAGHVPYRGGRRYGDVRTLFTDGGHHCGREVQDSVYSFFSSVVSGRDIRADK